MQKRQRQIITNFVVVIMVTLVSVVAMINFKDMVNRSEAIRAMEALGRQVVAYRQQYGAAPPESYVDRIRDSLPGNARLGDFQYRARWIGFGSPDGTILAYTRKQYRSSFLEDGAVVLRLDGTVEWMKASEFEPLLEEQQKADEREMLKEHVK
jgi:hypothetical protein